MLKPAIFFLQNLREPNQLFAQAVDARETLRIGASFTRLQTMLLKDRFSIDSTGDKERSRVISYGPCQFPTLGFIVERYWEIQAHEPEEFWTVNCSHESEDGLATKAENNFRQEEEESSVQIDYSSGSTMEIAMDYLGIDLRCAIGSLRNGEFPAKDCLFPLVSKLLGYFLVAASLTVKLPQIMKILENKSVRGLSVAAFEFEVLGYTILLAYCLDKKLPFSAYGELAFLLIQALILVACSYYFSRTLSVSTWVRAVLYFALAPILFTGRVDPLVFEALYGSKYLILLSSKVPLILKNFRNKSTGQLSFLTCLMNLGGAMARVFTSVQENAPFSMVMGIVLAVSMHGIIMIQIVLSMSKGEEKQVNDKKMS
ncbi:hypothetical protein F2Q69_00000982 [Brassica cretica]|uniref:DNA topoisomerase type IA domain-containing protein n=1 Tax=Brassica cretica TaxID=69181 RepID=A0A8S9PFB9_BRACR|nr:hypothetical protein F2Q69_00000982 [Brassica cretica]